MKNLQLILCVETNQKGKTDLQYLVAALHRFYEVNNGHTPINPVFLDGKYNFSSKSTVKKIEKFQKQFRSGSRTNESHVLICVDCDRYDSDPKDFQFLKNVEEYCNRMQNYHMVWFCRDIEDVFLGHQVTNNQKKKRSQ